MDNFSYETDEKELELQSNQTEDTEGADIEFDENFDIESIQKSLQEQMEGVIGDSQEQPDESTEVEQADAETEEITEESAIVFEEPSNDQSEDFDGEIDFEKLVPSFMQTLPTAEASPNEKKYVIYIEPENIEFIESLSIEDRKKIINKILREQDEAIAKQKRIEDRKKFLSHALTVCITFIIGLPIIFFIVNKATEVTIVNYREAQQNFIELYKSKGKYGPVSEKAARNIKF